MATDDDSEVPESGAVFTFGKSKFNDNVPGKFWIRDDKVVLVNCGDEHTALVAESGRVFTFGSNEWGQLGLGHDKPVNKPSRIKSLKNDPINLACCGKSHTILASRSGRLYGFGANNDGQVGNGEEKDKVLKPVHLKTLEDQQFSMLAAGSEHSAALTVSGDLYVWGGSSEGQLGFGDDESVNIPTKLDFDEKVTCVSCGYYHTAVVTESGKLYAFGETEDGKLGIGESPAENKSPQEVTDIEGSVVWVACGGTQTIAVTDSGRVYSFGNGSNGQLGHGTLSLQTPKPMNIGLPKSAKVKTSSCGNSHSAIVTEKGQLFTFGDGRHGKLALGEENFANQFKPTFVDRFEKFVVEGVSCGGCHMLVLAKPKLQNGDAWSEEDAEEEEEEEMPNGHGIEAIMKREGLSTSMDPDGSIVARNRRREKMPDPSGTLNRTLPPLNSTVRTSSSTLPPLGGSGDAPDNPLNRGRLAPIHIEKENSTMSAKPKKDSGDESGIEESGDEQPAIKKETSNTQRSLPQPRPRPAKRVDQQSDEEGKHENEDSEHDSVDSSKQKDDDDDGEPKPVPAARRPAKKQSEDEEEEEEEEQQQLKQISQSQSTKSKKPAASEDEEEEEKEDEEEDKKKKGKEKKKKEKDKKKKKISFFGKKQADSEEEDEEKENDEDEEEEEDDKKKKGKDKKAKKEKNKKKEKEKKSKKKAKDSEEEEDDLEEEEEEEEEEVSEEEDTAARGIFGRRKNNKKDKKKKEKEKDKKKKQKKKKEEEEEEETEDEEEEEEEKKPEPKPKVTVEPPKEKEEKKDEPKKEEPKKEEPKKKSRTCTIL